MSIDSYFCFCCLSNNELTNLCCTNTGVNYADLLRELVSIRPSQEYEENSYICEDCITKLKESHSFKTQVLKSINVLQINGLIELREVNGELTIQKACDEFSIDEQEFKVSVKEDSDVEVKDIVDIEVCKRDSITPSTPIKQELNQNTGHIATVTSPKIKTLTCPIKNPVAVFEKDPSGLNHARKKEKVLNFLVTDDLKCPMCSVVLPNVYTYHGHMNEHFPNHICTVCGKGFLNEQKLKRHKLTHNTGPFKCGTCDAVFRNYSSFYGHKARRHTPTRRHTCPHCPARLPTPAQRHHHLESEHGHVRRHVCAECGQRFMNSAHLNTHQRRLHLKEKRFICKECNAGFFAKEDLIGHMGTYHQGQRVYKCSLCTKSYLRKKALIIHMRLHTNDRPFHCDACTARFTQKVTLRKHLKTHEKNRQKKGGG